MNLRKTYPEPIGGPRQRSWNSALRTDQDEWLDLSLQLSFATLLPVDGPIAREAARLPDFHRDPADRFILATARLHHLDIVSADRRFSDYPGVKVIW